MLPKLEHSSPAPIRHSVKKKVENYDTDRKKYETTNFLPSNQHRLGGEDSGDSSGFLPVGMGLRLGGFGVGFRVANTERHRILPRFPYLSGRLLLVPFHIHILTT